VIAHPWGRGREHVLPPSLLEALVRDHGLDGIEVDHQDHDALTRQLLRTLAANLGLLPTGSSDYHGAGKLDHDLGCNTTDPEVFDEMQRRLAGR
jgi:3',5'-nucleoside bisphosphate phosphatase